MKSLTKTSLLKLTLVAAFSSILFSSCKKDISTTEEQQQLSSVARKSEHGHLKQTKTYSADVAIQWMNMQLELLRTITAPPFPRQNGWIAYCGLALYEAVVPGMPSYQSLSKQLNGLPPMPETQPGVEYHWPTCANAALAFMNKYFFTAANTNATNLAAMNALETSLNNIYQNEVTTTTFERSVDYGTAVAQIIADWSKTDGSATVYPLFVPAVPPLQPGDWVPTPPAFASAVTPITPYWGNIRLFVAGSLENSDPPPPPLYSTVPGSEYYNMHKEVYDLSLALTQEQKDIALFWRDNPGFSGPGHFMNIAKQILQQENAMLDLAAVTYAKVGITQADASVGSIGAKYHYFTERPITYIRGVLNHPTWNTMNTAGLFNTPAFPDYPSTHSTDCGAIGEALSQLFGKDYSYTDHSYDYLGMPSRSYDSFQDLFDEMINARVYAGIHTRNADIAGINQGRKIAQTINTKLKFKKS